MVFIQNNHQHNHITIIVRFCFLFFQKNKTINIIKKPKINLKHKEQTYKFLDGICI